MNRRVKTGVLMLVVVIVAALAGPAVPARAGSTVQGSSSPLALDVRVGFDGYIQQEIYFPITVTASNDGEDVSGELRVEAGQGGIDFIRTLDLPRGSRKQVTFYASGLTYGNELQVEFEQRGRVLASERVKVQIVSSLTLLIGVWSDSPQYFASLAEVKPSGGETVVALLSAEDLPPVGEGWRALDVLVVSDVDTGQLSADQRAAMRDWLVQGGRLIVVGGVGYQRTLSGLGDFSPVLAQDMQTVSLDRLALYSAEDFDVQARLDAPVAVGPLVEGARVALASDDVPLVAGRRLGYGRVDFLAADPGLEPLRSWKGMGDLWTAILSAGAARPAWAFGFNPNWEYARRAVAAVPGVNLPSVFQLCGFLFLYVALVGPINYFVLHRMKRRELAWLSIPLLVLLFSAIAYVTGFQLRGSRAILHRLAVIQVPAESEVGTVDALLGVWSPRRARYDVQLEPGYLARPLSQDFGGALTSVRKVTVAQGQAVTLRDIHVDVGSIQPFAVEGVVANPPHIQSELYYEPTQDGIRISGDVLNDSQVDLTSVYLVFGQSAQALGDLPGGQVVHVNQEGSLLSASVSPLDPFPNSGPYGGYYYGYTDLVYQISEESSAYGAQAGRRRLDLAASVMNGESYGTGVYLFGWAGRVPIETTVLNATSEAIDVALYIFELDVEPSPTQQRQTQISPGQMAWRLLENPADGYFMSPYDFYLPIESPLVVRFEPYMGMALPGLDTLIVHLEGYYDDSSDIPRVEVWNFEQKRWDEISVEWGDTWITDAGAYIDQIGGVELRIQGDEYSATSITRFDITLLGR